MKKESDESKDIKELKCISKTTNDEEMKVDINKRISQKARNGNTVIK